MDPASTLAARRGAVPARRALLQHRLGAVAALGSSLLPHLHDLADRAHGATVREWGPQPLPLAPAFR